jgi:hypothetical protein
MDKLHGRVVVHDLIDEWLKLFEEKVEFPYKIQINERDLILIHENGKKEYIGK